MSKKSKNSGGEPEKTNAARLLDKARIPYRLVPYEVDKNDLSATHVAETLGEDVAMVFKTLVLHGERTGGGGHFVCVIPGAAEVDRDEEGRDDSDEGTFAPDRIYPGRMHRHRHEETVSGIFPYFRHSV